jgi:UrcA family protein
MVSKGRMGFKVSVVAGMLGVMGLGMAAVQASAQMPDVTVRFADLDLNTAQGASALYTRIRHAAEEVCPGAESLSVPLRMAALSCRNKVVAHAVASVGSPQLAAVYAERARNGAV